MFESNKKDPLVESVKKTIVEGNLRREVVRRINEKLDIHSRTELPHQHVDEYDSIVNKAIYNTLNEGKVALDNEILEGFYKDKLVAKNEKKRLQMRSIMRAHKKDEPEEGTESVEQSRKMAKKKNPEKAKDFGESIEEETLNELSGKTLGSYVKKAVSKVNRYKFLSGAVEAGGRSGQVTDKTKNKMGKRIAGIDKAVDKMVKKTTNEEVLEEAKEIKTVSAAKKAFASYNKKFGYDKKFGADKDKKKVNGDAAARLKIANIQKKDSVDKLAAQNMQDKYDRLFKSKKKTAEKGTTKSQGQADDIREAGPVPMPRPRPAIKSNITPATPYKPKGNLETPSIAQRIDMGTIPPKTNLPGPLSAPITPNAAPTGWNKDQSVKPFPSPIQPATMFSGKTPAYTPPDDIKPATPITSVAAQIPTPPVATPPVVNRPASVAPTQSAPRPSPAPSRNSGEENWFNQAKGNLGESVEAVIRKRILNESNLSNG